MTSLRVWSFSTQHTRNYTYVLQHTSLLHSSLPASHLCRFYEQQYSPYHGSYGCQQAHKLRVEGWTMWCVCVCVCVCVGVGVGVCARTFVCPCCLHLQTAMAQLSRGITDVDLNLSSSAPHSPRIPSHHSPHTSPTRRPNPTVPSVPSVPVPGASVDLARDEGLATVLQACLER